MTDLEDILAYCEAATPEPWNYMSGILKHYVVSDDERGTFRIGLQELHWRDGELTNAEADAKFIAQARTDLPRVTTKLIAARHHIADLEESRDSWRDSAKAVGEELQQARGLVDPTKRLVRHVSVGNRDAAWIAAREVDGLLAEYDRVKKGGG